MSASADIRGVFGALAALRTHGGPLVMCISARRGEGASTIARATAEPAARFARRAALLIDLDLARDSQHRFYADRGRVLGKVRPGDIAGLSFFRAVSGSGERDVEAESRFGFVRAGEERLFVGAFAGAGLRSAIQILPDADYWTAVRAGAEFCVVDAPAFERSRAGLTIARHMDGVVMVVSGAAESATDAIALKGELVAAGARVIGVVYAQADPAAHALERLSMARKAG